MIGDNKNNQVSLGNIVDISGSDSCDAGLSSPCCSLHQSVELHERDAVLSVSSLTSSLGVTQAKSDNWQKQRSELFILEIIIKEFSFWFLLYKSNEL